MTPQYRRAPTAATTGLARVLITLSRKSAPSTKRMADATSSLVVLAHWTGRPTVYTRPRATPQLGRGLRCRRGTLGLGSAAACPAPGKPCQCLKARVHAGVALAQRVVEGVAGDVGVVLEAVVERKGHEGEMSTRRSIEHTHAKTHVTQRINARTNATEDGTQRVDGVTKRIHDARQHATDRRTHSNRPED